MSLTETLEYLVSKGNLELLKFFRKYLKCSGKISELAAKNGQLDIIKWLHEQGEVFPVQTVINSAMKGHLELLKFLVEKGYCIPNYTVELAAGNGHLEVVKYLFELPNSKYYSIDNILESAIKSGNLEMVKYLHSLGLNFARYLVDKAAINGHLEILKWFYEKGYSCSVSGAFYAIKKNQLKIMDFLFNKDKESYLAAIELFSNKGMLGFLPRIRVLE
jgi:hypothetical protein